jgi:hypothetical protein
MPSLVLTLPWREKLSVHARWVNSVAYADVVHGWPSCETFRRRTPRARVDSRGESWRSGRTSSASGWPRSRCRLNRNCRRRPPRGPAPGRQSADGLGSNGGVTAGATGAFPRAMQEGSGQSNEKTARTSNHGQCLVPSIIRKPTPRVGSSDQRTTKRSSCSRIPSSVLSSTLQSPPLWRSTVSRL